MVKEKVRETKKTLIVNLRKRKVRDIFSLVIYKYKVQTRIKKQI